MRVIAGSARGMPLRAPRGGATRPITDRVKETLFGILADRVLGARVLDLYAGSGSIGIEALSRGAAWCTFVEQDHAAAAVLRDNLRRTGLEDRATVRTSKVERFLSGPGIGPVDLVVLDPPYLQHAILEPLTRLVPLLEPRATVVVKHHWRTDLALPDALATWRERRFGETALTFLEVRQP
ncbi:MAG TPA: 16S rRNA (guanine(966)-N(2))-methyltransferase RsmD [Candidatus Limnocylindria bacterium]|nr:16S rRNA (guanine(966)-N(2))-methyltransferase RsmD [Candidatus Limnocylindria bacterium]